ncbi:MAG: hypothetical protein PHQ59_05785 [Candidatus Daviesbacteria bacterium]|nr:hypothetical protein [Candidatus Daviesbacteria bacterium]
MPKTLLFEIIALIASLAVAIISLALYLGEYYKRTKEKNAKSGFQTIDATEAKSLNVLYRAIKKAQAIIGNAELAGIKIGAENRLAEKKLEGTFESQLNVARTDLEKEMSSQMNKTYSEYIKFLETLKEQNNQIQAINQEAIKQRANSIFDKFEQNLGTFLTSTEQKSVASIELELRSARQLIETYKTEQIAIIDENIISILERTLALVLAKKIPLKDQVDLVYEALSKAKVEKFIA